MIMKMNLYDDFRNGDVQMVKAYRKASELRDRRNNQDMWLQGKYFYDALCAASPLYRFTMKKARAVYQRTLSYHRGRAS